MTDRELMQIALDALDKLLDKLNADICDNSGIWDEYCDGGNAMQALRARLAQPEPEPINYEDWNYNPMTGEPLWGKQPEQEPVAWMYEYGTDNGDAVNEVRWYKNVSLTQQVLTYNRNVVPLYTTPPQREWQGLTDEEMHECAGEYPWTPTGLKCCRAIEAKLKEKNT